MYNRITSRWTPKQVPLCTNSQAFVRFKIAGFGTVFISKKTAAARNPLDPQIGQCGLAAEPKTIRTMLLQEVANRNHELFLRVDPLHRLPHH